MSDLDLNKIIDVGNELCRLVLETRDSIHESNTLVNTGEFPDTPEGQAGKEWFEEYKSAAEAWRKAVTEK